MRRIDRAIFAIFLLALVADVARSYASVPVGSEVSGTLILGAASQLHPGGPANTVFPFRRAGSQLPLLEKRTHRAPVLAAWSMALLGPSAQWSQVAILQPASIFATPPGSHLDLPQPSLFSPLARIEHAGNPAP
ncbi:MAG TPA: hypothetical protein VL346_01475 [Acidobacteriaceae bacterium]|nr:hypothetical protein [Acidobacteriaceae bacterium]